jgi:hypothetical protein
MSGVPGIYPLPNRGQARRLVACLAVFWGVWAVLASSLVLTLPGAVAAISFFVAFASGAAFFLTLYSIWQPTAGASLWRLMFWPYSVRFHAMSALLRPSWVRAVLRATEWPVLLVGACLALLLALDLAIVFGLLINHDFPRY